MGPIGQHWRRHRVAEPDAVGRRAGARSVRRRLRLREAGPRRGLRRLWRRLRRRGRRLRAWAALAVVAAVVIAVVWLVGSHRARVGFPEAGSAMPAAVAPRRTLPPPPFAEAWEPEAVGQYLCALAGATDRVHVGVIGASVQGRPLYAVRLGAEAPPARGPRPWRIAIVAGQHGNEPAAVVGVLQFIWDLCARSPDTYPWIDRDIALLVIPQANPDGAAARTRTTAARADLNRDWPRRSLRETQAIGRALDAFGPDLVVDCHELLPGDKRQRPYVEVACSDEAERKPLGREAERLRREVATTLAARGCPIETFRRFGEMGPSLHAYYGVTRATLAMLVESAPQPPGWRVELHHKVLWTMLGFIREVGGRPPAGGTKVSRPATPAVHPPAPASRPATSAAPARGSGKPGQ